MAYARAVTPPPATATAPCDGTDGAPVEVATTSGAVPLEPGLYLPIFTGLQDISAVGTAGPIPIVGSGQARQFWPGSAALAVRIERDVDGTIGLLALGQSQVTSSGDGGGQADREATLGTFHVDETAEVHIRFVARAHNCAHADIRGRIELLRIGS